MKYKIKQIQIDFNVTPEIKRYVFVYLLETKHGCYLIDSGVQGCEQTIINELNQLHKEITDIKGIFLTHAHPDHIGTAAWFKEQTGCKVYASNGEKRWIEDIDLQFRERPIPNFYALAGKSVGIDHVVSDGDEIWLEEDLCMKVIETPGHSVDEVSYQIGIDVFVGDSIPVKGDIPIYVDKMKSLVSLSRIKNLSNVENYYPAWDRTYSKSDLQQKVTEAEQIIETIDEAVNTVKHRNPDTDLHVVTAEVAKLLNKPMLLGNPLFAKTVECHW